MDESRDLDLGVTVADSDEERSDDDFKPSLRKVGFSQQLAFNARRIFKQEQQQPKRKPDKKKDVKGTSPVEDLRSGDEGPHRKVRKQAIKREIIPRMDSSVDDSVKRTSLRSMAELESFRYTLGGAHSLSEVVPVEEQELKPVEAFPVEANCQIEISNTDHGADNVCENDSAADHAECLVIDIDTDEVVELCDETQFSVLLRLCGEECEQDGLRADVTDVDRVPTGDGTLVNSLSTLDEPTTSVMNSRGLPCLVEGCESTQTDIVSIHLEGSNPKQLVAESTVSIHLEGSNPKQLVAESTAAPSTNTHDADLPVVQDGIGVEQQCSQDPFCDDVISSMMTQKCVSQSEEVQAFRRISPSPLKNISNLPARVDINKQGVKMKSMIQAVNKTDSEDTNSDHAVDKKETKQIRRPVFQVLQLEGSSEELCQNKENIGDAPYDTIVIEHQSVSGNAMEHSVVPEGHKTVVEDVLLYSEEVRETIQCPVCGENISGNTVEERLAHTNSCLDKLDTVQEGFAQEEGHSNGSSLVHGSDEVKYWLDKLNLSRYVSLFVEQEIDWDTLPWLTEEDLVVMGVAAVGPRRKMFLAIQELKRGSSGGGTEPQNVSAAPTSALVNASAIQIPPRPPDGISRIPQADGGESSNRITNYFPLPPESGRKQLHETTSTIMVQRTGVVKNKTCNRPRSSVYQNTSRIPAWMCIPGTPFRVDAFQHLSGDCSYWFLTHFHTDHYQGLTRGFRYGHIFCSSITARLVNLRIGVSWEKLMIIPLQEKVKIAGVDVTFIDANHCPGSVMILFEPPNGEAVLHTGDFRFCTEMANNSLLQTTKIHTLVLDTTFCDPQYDFPTQDTVIRFIIEAIQAEMFNKDTLFLIGTYTIGKERIFLEVGKVLKKYVYVGAPKKKLLDCMDLSADDTKWLTCNEHESFIHVVPLWSISSFKRMSSIARHYQNRYKLIVAFSPTGWSFGRGKKKTPGKRWKQGTMIRYEVPYSEHCSFPELREFLRFIAPEDIIPSVPGKDGVGADAMIATLCTEDK